MRNGALYEQNLQLSCFAMAFPEFFPCERIGFAGYHLFDGQMPIVTGSPNLLFDVDSASDFLPNSSLNALLFRVCFFARYAFFFLFFLSGLGLGIGNNRSS